MKGIFFFSCQLSDNFFKRITINEHCKTGFIKDVMTNHSLSISSGDLETLMNCRQLQRGIFRQSYKSSLDKAEASRVKVLKNPNDPVRSNMQNQQDQEEEQQQPCHDILLPTPLPSVDPCFHIRQIPDQILEAAPFYFKPAKVGYPAISIARAPIAISNQGFLPLFIVGSAHSISATTYNFQGPPGFITGLPYSSLTPVPNFGGSAHSHLPAITYMAALPPRNLQF
jgi:hypothetical protein